MHYYGFKMQLMITQKGVPISVGITSANLHDVKYLGLLDNKAQLSDYELIADKGYLSAQYQTRLFEEDKIKLITPAEVVGFKGSERIESVDIEINGARMNIETDYFITLFGLTPK